MARKGSTKVRTGCLTCKIRKVKCDEAEPCCKRCTSTGRKCDGYPQTRLDLSLHEPIHLNMTDSSGDEVRALAFFRQMAGPALSGHSESYFWTNVVMQLSHHKPAVRHAVLAVSSLYEQFQEVSKSTNVASTNLFALRHYNAAIKELRLARDETVVLVVCALFICVESLQGNHQSAIEHCRSGILVFNKADSLTVWARDHLLGVFCRMGVFPFFFGCDASSFPCVAGLIPGSSAPFSSIMDAQSSLDLILSASIRFVRCSDKYRLGELRQSSIPESMREKQDSLVKSLDKWQCAFSNSRKESGSDLLTCCLLQMKALVVQIWVNVALEQSEMAYDQYVDRFQSIIDLASQAALSRSQQSRPRPSFIFDMGFTPLLYFAAMKCRDLSIRLVALSFMTTLGVARETLWDLSTMYRVARRLIEIEHDIDLDSPQNPLPRHIVLEERRVKEVLLRDLEFRRDEHGCKQLWAHMHSIVWRPIDELVTQSEWITLS
ncbi:hypothetical protein EDD36DRAFT_308724 [Exophiala viscosa]|uniref:Zn(2)-C6 fungal-type domain-containing protein n=1 Tax=Exophiala viscosa TaxID=2486360 RepID=A0AAN6DUD1_9EURO|nr:hypothetical protein EDD36DRAFT_308724 [Exophiala viscosa]